MTAQPSGYNSRDPRPEETDPVWRLLGQAPRPMPDAWFTVRTLARCRLADAAEPRGIVFARAWRWALGGGLGVCLALILAARPHPTAPAGSTNQKGVQEAFEIMASMAPDADATPPSSDTSSWQDSSL